GDRDGQALPHQQVVDPGDQLGGAVAHRHRLGMQPHRGGQLGGDGAGAAGIVLEDRLQVLPQVLEDLRRGEVRVAGDAEVHRRAPAVGVAQQREVRGTVRLGTQTAELHETSMRRPMRRNVWRYARPGVRVQRLYNVDRPAPGRDRARPSLDQWRWCLRWWWRWPRTFTDRKSVVEGKGVR